MSMTTSMGWNTKLFPQSRPPNYQKPKNTSSSGVLSPTRMTIIPCKYFGQSRCTRIILPTVQDWGLRNNNTDALLKSKARVSGRYERNKTASRHPLRWSTVLQDGKMYDSALERLWSFCHLETDREPRIVPRCWWQATEDDDVGEENTTAGWYGSADFICTDEEIRVPGREDVGNIYS